jgi:hypothetical protein
MPLDAARANTKTGAINDAFAAIGTAAGNGTSMPRSKKNTEPVAWEYHCASHLARIAEARKAKAIAAAVKAGVMFDPAKQPLPVGSNALVYAGEVVEIACTVGTAATRLDAAAFADDLEKAGVKRALIDRLALKHTIENRAPHKFTSSLVTA